MSLRNSYFDYASGLNQKMIDFYSAGVDWVGASAKEVQSATISASVSDADWILIYNGASTAIAFWFDVTGGAVQPTVTGATSYVKVRVAAADSAKAQAAILANAINNANASLSAICVNDSNLVTITCVDVGNFTNITKSGSNIAVATSTAGSSTGNISSISASLRENAAKGNVKFTVTLDVSYQTAALKQNALAWNFFKSGLIDALLLESIYVHECSAILNTKDSQTKVDLNFDMFNVKGI